MAIGPENRTVYRTSGGTQAVGVDQGLRSYMLGVYNYVGGGLVLSGIVAFLLASNPALLATFYKVGIDPQTGYHYAAPTGLGWIAIFAPLGLMFYVSFAIRNMATTTLQAVYWVFTALMGVSLTNLAIIYTGESIARTFFVVAAMFLGMSLFGYTTKRDLTSIGHFLRMGLWGLLLAIVVSFFFPGGALTFAISVAAVVIFTGLTAYDTQRIKWSYVESDGRDVAVKKSIMGALNLYLDFINLLQFMMMLFGNRR
jgi:FtsH-binding integral membrane protein